jgi:AraC-like DNA-binding protein
MTKSKKKLDLNYSENKISDDFSIIRYSGNHWDDIFYFPKHYQIGIVQKGEGVFSTGQTDFTLREGDTYFIKPSLVHKGKPDPQIGWTITELNFSPTLIDNLQNEGATFSIFNTLKPIEPITESVSELIAHFDNEIDLEEATNILIDFLVDFSDKLPSVSNYHEAIIRARKFIEANYKSKYSLDELAKQAYLSKFHLVRLFKQEVGLSPHTYQLQLKLNEARKLIFQKKTLTEVAYELGFNDQAHFINTYKKYTEITPSEFLKTAIFYNS